MFSLWKYSNGYGEFVSSGTLASVLEAVLVRQSHARGQGADESIQLFSLANADDHLNGCRDACLRILTEINEA